MRNFEFYGYNETILNPIALVVTILMGFLILYLERKYIIIPIMIVVCYIPDIQRIVIGGIDIDMVRILLLFALLRFFLRREKIEVNTNAIDKAFYIYTLIGSIAYILLRKTGGAVVNRLGFMFNAFGLYIFIRYAIKNTTDAMLLIKTLIIFSIPIALSMISEQITGRNIFSIFGGVPEFTFIREGKLRSQGAFPHAILAGTFGALLIPLIWGYHSNVKKVKALKIIGLIMGTIITITSSSSGPILTFMAGLIGIFAFRFRKVMHKVRRSIVATIVVLDLAMAGPVWSIIWRVTIVGGSTGYHRFMILDEAIKRFREWALLGTTSTAHWGWGLQDVTNMYVRVGVNGGFLALAFFIYIIVLYFKAIGNLRQKVEGNIIAEKHIWGYGVILFAHCVTFFGVSYFGNMIFFFYLSIATLSSYTNFIDDDLAFWKKKID